MSTYRIVDWDQHYEVDKDGRVWTEGKTFRQGPLEYVRVPARRDWNLKILELHDEVADHVWFYVGAFEKLCGIVGCEPRSRREGGIIRNSSGEPASLEEIARMLRVQPRTAQELLRRLSQPQIRWLEEVPPTENSVASPHSAKPAIGAAIGAVAENCLKSSQVESRQSTTSQVKSRGPVSIGMTLGQLGLVPPPEPRLDRSRTLLDSTRLDFLYEIRQTLGAKEAADSHTVSNFEAWVHENVSSGRAGPELRKTALKLARDCVRGEKPVAVFLARAKQELGYVAPSRRPGRAGLQEGNL